MIRRLEIFAFLMRYSAGRASCFASFWNDHVSLNGGVSGWAEQSEQNEASTHVYLETNISKLENILEAQTQVKIVEIQSIVLDQVPLGQGIA